MTLPTDAKERKNVPMARGLLDYFPDALAAVADVSRVGNEQHNPGQPMHWSKHLSTDHADCLIRHLVDRGRMDSDNLRHSAKVAWRALALLQTELEEEQEKIGQKIGQTEPERQDLGNGAWIVDCTKSIEQQLEKAAQKKSDAEILLEKAQQKYGGGFDVCGDVPTMSFCHCEGCHSLVCQQAGTCMHQHKKPH